MKKQAIIILFGIFSPFFLQGQNPGCDGIRYKNNIFDSIVVSSDITYGNNISIGGSEVELKLDVYQPYQDTIVMRPAVFLVHGGGFTSGSKSGYRSEKLGTDYAKKGYIAISIDYRLYDLKHPPDSFLLKDAIVRGMADLKAAMRFMVEDAASHNEYRIDSNNIFLCGASSGAIIANTTAYLDNLNEADSQMRQIIIEQGGLPGNSSSNYQFKPAPKAVFNSSGGMLDYSYIDANDPPLVSIHCANDPVMPFKRNWLIIMGDSVAKAYGSSFLHGRASMLEIENELIRVPGTIHMQYYLNPVYYDSLMNTSAEMFHNITCNDSGGGIPVKIPEQIISSSGIYPNPANQYVIIKDFQSGKVEIYNSVGLLVKKERMHQKRIELHDLKPGMYFLIVKQENMLKSHKLIISR